MMRFLLQFLILLLLLTLQVSFIHALTYPFDRIPLVLVVTIYLFQYTNQSAVWWWLVCYGFVLDILSLSLAPLEIISYSLVAVGMNLLVAHVFTNRSFYGMAATALLCLLVLSLSELTLLGLSSTFSSEPFLWKSILTTNLWAVAFSGFLLLFVFPSWRQIRFFALHLFSHRF